MRRFTSQSAKFCDKISSAAVSPPGYRFKCSGAVPAALT
jgi:hypothetical protein